MSWRHLLGMLLVVSGCGSDAASRPPAAIADTPIADPVIAYAQAEAALRAHVAALALDAAIGVVAAHARRVEDEGPELVWYPTLRHVAARQRHVTYGTPAAGDVQRGLDPAQPFLVEIIVPCLVQTMSGEGVTYVGDAPPQDEPVSDRMLPQATIASDSAALAEDLSPAAMAALASCATAEPVAETVRITLLFAFQRDQNAVVLLRHARNAARAP